MGYKRTFLNDASDFVSLCTHSFENDDFSNCFSLTSPYEMNSSGIFYPLFFIIRYFILLPIRVVLLFGGVIIIGSFFIYGKMFSDYKIISNSFLMFNKWIVFVMCFRIKHHGVKKIIDEPHVYVSNHTSLIDYVVLSSHKFSHACIAEGHGGLFGFILSRILRENGSIGFNRSDKQDRQQVIAKIKNHIHKNQSPMLIFPEGTCVNNRYCVLFQKGAFELNALICPVAIKYSNRLCEPYWNRRLHGFSMHVFYLLTRWKLDLDVFWLPSTKIYPNETTLDFSHRVKCEIAKTINLKSTLWNGAFKSSPVLNDREIFKKCFNRVYNKLKSNVDDNKDKEKLYFNEENIDMTSTNENIYFGDIKYKNFIVNCCKEYLKMKTNEI